MTDHTLKGRRILVAGASAGIGRSFAVHALSQGAQVVLAGRRAEKLHQVVDAAGAGTPVACDLGTAEGCRTLVDAARTELGGIDLLVNAVGVAPLRLLLHATEDDWHRTLQTNVVGVNELLRGCLELLTPQSVVAILSSEAVGQGRPTMNVYSATKAALDQLIVGWRAEYPDVRLTRVEVGSVFDTEFSRDFGEDAELLGWALTDWKARGLLPANFMLSDQVGEALAGLLATVVAVPSVGVDSLSIRPVGAIDGAPAPMATIGATSVG